MPNYWGAVALATLFVAGCSAETNEPPVAEVETANAANPASAGIETRVHTRDTVKITDEDWGEFAEYFAGETAGVGDLLSGTATIKPGLEIHPPHRHAEEEFLMVIEGEGEWTVGEETFPAKTGDMIYAAAWDLHGIKNTGDEPLTFVFWKWNSKGLPVPVDPEL